MTTHQNRSRALVLPLPTAGTDGARSYPRIDDARSRARLREAYVRVFDVLDGPRPRARRWAIEEATRGDAEARGNCGFITRMRDDCRLALEQGRAEGPASLARVRDAVREFAAQWEREVLNGFEVVTVDVSALPDEVEDVAREAQDVAPAALAFIRHRTAGAWAHFKRQVAEVLDQMREAEPLGVATFETPSAVPPVGPRPTTPHPRPAA